VFVVKFCRVLGLGRLLFEQVSLLGGEWVLDKQFSDSVLQGLLPPGSVHLSGSVAAEDAELDGFDCSVGESCDAVDLAYGSAGHPDGPGSCFLQECFDCFRVKFFHVLIPSVNILTEFSAFAFQFRLETILFHVSAAKSCECIPVLSMAT